MTEFPAYQLDPAAVPPPILTSEVGSFAHNTLQVRVPGILRETMALNEFPPPVMAALQALHDELIQGVLRPLQEVAADRPFWDLAVAPHVGHTWLDVPWYFAEAYFYRRILEATGYFQPGPWQGFDPFAVKKATEWAPEAAPRLLAQSLQDLPEEPEERFRRLIYASLWGNRTDLSYAVSMQMAREQEMADVGEDQANLLVDDWQDVWQHLSNRPPGCIVMIADNTGSELLMDLALIDHLLGQGLATQVSLHLKPQPYFVSDCMARDVAAALAVMSAGSHRPRCLAQRLWSYQESGHLRLSSHWFYASSLFYFQLPHDLYQELATARLVVVKGDANYRRLLGDAHWPRTTPFVQALAYFPAPMVAVRTLKGEVMVGLVQGQEDVLRAADPQWLVNGKRGVIQSRLP